MLNKVISQADGSPEPSGRSQPPKSLSTSTSFSRLLKVKSHHSDELPLPAEDQVLRRSNTPSERSNLEANIAYVAPAVPPGQETQSGGSVALRPVARDLETNSSNQDFNAANRSESEGVKAVEGSTSQKLNAESSEDAGPPSGNAKSATQESQEAELTKKAEAFIQRNATSDPEPGDLIRRVMETADPRSAAFVASVRFAGLKADHRANLLDKLRSESVGDFKASVDLGISGSSSLGSLRIDAVAQKGMVSRSGLPPEFLNNIKFALSRNLDSITMKVAPEGVGSLTIKIDQAAGMLNINIQAKDAALASQIQASLGDMRSLFDQKGLLLGDVLVSSEPYADGSFFEGNQHENEREKTSNQDADGVEVSVSDEPTRVDEDVISRA